MDVDGQPIGTCHSFCRGTADDPQCPPPSSCLISSGIYGLCIYGCDPILQDCGAGLGCYWANNNFNCIFTTEDIGVGEPCAFINDCAAGLNCLDAKLLPDCAGAACCSGFCELGLGDGPCAELPGTSCVALFGPDMAPPGYEHVGMCMVP